MKRIITLTFLVYKFSVTFFCTGQVGISQHVSRAFTLSCSVSFVFCLVLSSVFYIFYLVCILPRFVFCLILSSILFVFYLVLWYVSFYFLSRWYSTSFCGPSRFIFYLVCICLILPRFVFCLILSFISFVFCFVLSSI